MTRKKSGFITFLCSLLPGAGEMYMGFMKMGISLMGIFFVTIALASWLEIGPLVFVAVIIWFYSFFHVHNLHSLPDEEFYAIEDDYLFHLGNEEKNNPETVKTQKKVVAVILILVGVLLLWKTALSSLRYYFPEAFGILDYVGSFIPRIVVAVIIIALGVYMIRGKKRHIEEETENGREE